MSKLSDACKISKETAEAVKQRDNYKCIICGGTDIQIAHYVSRARLGLGIAENLCCLCVNCHYNFDNGKHHNEIKEVVKEHLQEQYPDWDETKLTYRKWGF